MSTAADAARPLRRVLARHPDGNDRVLGESKALIRDYLHRYVDRQEWRAAAPTELDQGNVGVGRTLAAARV